MAFIQSGSCIALVRVPRSPRFTQVSSYGNRKICHVSVLVCFPCMQVMVGHLETGDCIGEGMLRGNDHQPYTIVSTTKLRVGWVTTTTLRGKRKVKPLKSLLCTNLGLIPNNLFFFPGFYSQ